MFSSGHIQTDTFIAAWNTRVCVCVCPQDSAVVTYLESCHRETEEDGQLRLNPWGTTLASDRFTFKIQLLILQTWLPAPLDAAVVVNFMGPLGGGLQFQAHAHLCKFQITFIIVYFIIVLLYY